MQASHALQQKNNIIHGLQMRLKEIRNEDGVVSSGREVSHLPSQPDVGPVDSTLSLQELQSQLQRCNDELTIQKSISNSLQVELDSLREYASGAEQRAAMAQCCSEEKDATIEELAALIASREASQVALVETVQAFINHQLPSMPATPRDGSSRDGHDGEGEVAARRFEAMVSFWQDRLRAQAELSTLKLRGVSADEFDSTIEDTLTAQNEEETADESSENSSCTPSEEQSPTATGGKRLLVAECSAGDLAPITPL